MRELTNFQLMEQKCDAYRREHETTLLYVIAVLPLMANVDHNLKYVSNFFSRNFICRFSKNVIKKLSNDLFLHGYSYYNIRLYVAINSNFFVA